MVVLSSRGEPNAPLLANSGSSSLHGVVGQVHELVFKVCGIGAEMGMSWARVGHDVEGMSTAHKNNTREQHKRAPTCRLVYEVPYVCNAARPLTPTTSQARIN